MIPRKLKSPLIKKSTPVAVPVKNASPSSSHKRVAGVSLEFVRPGATRVCVAGSFNGWKPEQAPLVPMGDGRWVGNITVDPGRYEYLFVVDGQWLPDPNAKENVTNPFGGVNSVLMVHGRGA